MIRSCLIVLSENEQKRYPVVEVTPESLKEAAELLGIGGRASFNEIRQAYHDRIKKWHPDVSTQDPAMAHDMTIRVKMAYDLLVDYCMNHTFSFRIEDLAKDLEQSPADFWMERFGDDPIWG
jgi:hypothetical protein